MNLLKNCFVLMIIFLISACENGVKIDIPNPYYDKPILKRIEKQKEVSTHFYVGPKGSNEWSFGKNKSYFIEVEPFPITKEEMIKKFITAYNEKNKTDYNAMVKIEISNNLSWFNPADHYEISGILLKIEE